MVPEIGCRYQDHGELFSATGNENSGNSWLQTLGHGSVTQDE